MINDPVVQILHEAAARGRQLRLASEQAARSETCSDSAVAEAQLPDQGVGNTMTSQQGANVSEEESAI